MGERAEEAEGAKGAVSSGQLKLWGIFLIQCWRVVEEFFLVAKFIFDKNAGENE